MENRAFAPLLHFAQYFQIHDISKASKAVITELRVNIVSKGAKIRNRYNQVPHLTQDTNGKVTNSQ